MLYIQHTLCKCFSPEGPKHYTTIILERIMNVCYNHNIVRTVHLIWNAKNGGKVKHVIFSLEDELPIA